MPPRREEADLEQDRRAWACRTDGPAGPGGCPRRRLAGGHRPTARAGRAAAARISALESQVSQLGSQYDALLAQVGALGGQITGLGSEFSAFKTVACDQLGDLTSQSNDLGTALDNIDLGGTIPLGLNFINPGAPAALPAFAC
jgi:hypothetical protein